MNEVPRRQLIPGARSINAILNFPAYGMAIGRAELRGSAFAPKHPEGDSMLANCFQGTRISTRTRRCAAHACAVLSLSLGAIAANFAHAQTAWVGDTSQDWNNAANWASDPNAPT